MTTNVITYVDGFNLYYAMRKKKWQRYYWLNVREMSNQLLTSDQTLVATKYFTSRVKGNQDKWERQNSFLSALRTLSGLKIIEGSHEKRQEYCPRRGHYHNTFEEKMTDVNIAVTLLDDAFFVRFDMALLISADGDLTKPVSLVKRLLPLKRVVVGFPPGYSSFSLSQVADAYFTIGRKTLKDSQLPRRVRITGGIYATRPFKWR